jgi:hypothetical protein
METDWVIGQIVKAVDDSGLTDNTLIIVTADNGCSPAARRGSKQLVFNGAKKEPVQPDKHYPCNVYRGHKADIYEGGHRVPFIARWKGKVKAGSTCSDTVCLTDLYATCAAILGKKLADVEAPDSISILPNLLGTAKGPLREATVHHSINGAFAIRQGNWKLIMCPGSGGWSAPKGKGCQRLAIHPAIRPDSRCRRERQRSGHASRGRKKADRSAYQVCHRRQKYARCQAVQYWTQTLAATQLDEPGEEVTRLCGVSFFFHRERRVLIVHHELRLSEPAFHFSEQ